MPLRDVTSVVFNRGTGEFNESAALEAYHLVAKMDDASASEFVFHVVNEVLENTIVENRDVLQKHLDRTIAKCLVYADLDAVAEGLNANERQEVKKQLLAAVSKATEAEQAAWNHRDKSGRFTTFDHPIAGGEIDAATGKALKVPPHPDRKSDEMSGQHERQYRAQYLQIANALDEHDGFNGDNDVMLHYSNGETKPLIRVTPERLAAAINPHEGENVDKVTIRPYRPSLNGRVVDLTSSLGGGATRGLQTAGTNEFATQWNTAHPINSTEQMYNRVGAGSKLLAQVAPGSAKLQAAAGFGSLVGQHGSQAEQAFGPPVRRMAYRYRGTERRPRADLVRDYGNAIHSAKSQSGSFTPQENADRAPNFQEREAGRDVIIDWLQKEERAPRRELSSLQLAAGHTPPSEGVLLNADGQIVTTAVGASDDWYVPFNLRHLQQLKGGEYIRSRSTGGLTTEDIYTGLMSGARKVTVVSRSGVFSVDFDNELRGGRRYNDKALRMTQRYGELLDAVQSQQVQRQPLKPEEEREIKAQVARDYEYYTPEQREAKVKDIIRQRMDNPESIDAEVDQANAYWDAQAADHDLSPEEKTARQREVAGLLGKKEYYWKLNGLGYKGAQDALQEQFPYYIKSSTRFTVGRSAPLGGNDRGYVEPGALRPTAARANLFGGAQGPNGGKIAEQKTAMSARNADHAMPMVDRYNRGSDASESGAGSPGTPKAPEGGGGAGSGKSLPQMSDEDALAEYQRQKKILTTAQVIHQGALQDTLVLKDADTNAETKDPPAAFKDLYKYRHMSDDDFASAIRRDPEKFRQTYKAALKVNQKPDFQFTGRKEFEEALGPESLGPFNYDEAVKHPDALFTFPDAGDDERAAAAKTPLALTPGAHAGDADVKEADLKREAEMVKVIEETSDNPAITPAALKAEDLLPMDERGRDLVKNIIASADERKAYARNISLAREAKAKPKAMALPAVPASPEVQAHEAAQNRQPSRMPKDEADYDAWKRGEWE